MIDTNPVPRPHLFSNRDADAWEEQLRVLLYVARLTPLQIAQVDYGLDPEHPEAGMALAWAHEIAKTFPRVDLGGFGLER